MVNMQDDTQRHEFETIGMVFEGQWLVTFFELVIFSTPVASAVCQLGNSGGESFNALLLLGIFEFPLYIILGSFGACCWH